MSNHPIVHVEISAQDRKELAGFYGDVFGWEHQSFDEVNYTTFTYGEENRGGGYNPVSDDSPVGTIVPYIHTDSLEDSLSRIEARGGKVLVPPMDVPGSGRIAQFSDPTGNRMGLYQPVNGASG